MDLPTVRLLKFSSTFVRLLEISLFILILLFFGSMEANPISITFKELSKPEYLNQEIAIRGFLYLKGESHWILAAEPNLKTCCIGSVQKSDSQIILDANFQSFPTNKVILVEGTLAVEEGVFHLKNPNAIKSSDFNLFVFFAILFVIFSGSALIYRIILRHNRKRIIATKRF